MKKNKTKDMNKVSWKFGLGQPVIDKLSGAKGHIFSRADEVTGCNSYMVTFPNPNNPIEPYETQFNEPQLKEDSEGEWLEDSIKDLDKSSSGFVFDIGNQVKPKVSEAKCFIKARVQSLYNANFYIVEKLSEFSLDKSRSTFHATELELLGGPVKDRSGKDVDTSVPKKAAGSNVDLKSLMP